MKFRLRPSYTFQTLIQTLFECFKKDYLPYTPIFMDHFSKWYRRSFAVAGAFISRHTFATVIHVGSIYAGAAVNWDKLNVACDIRLTQRAAGGLTGRDGIAVAQGFGT